MRTHHFRFEGHLRRRTTLVLGAGASCSYGFPVGSGLRQGLLRLGQDPDRTAEILGVGKQTLRHFVKSFLVSQAYSIDAFLGRRWQEFETVGKAAIAHALLGAERGCDLFNENHADHWYQYLANELVADSTWETFDPSWLSIVTFNYDRSLEVFLCRALQEVFGKSEAEVVARLRQIPIVHVYGSLGSPWPGDEGFLPLSTNDIEAAVAPAAARIRVIPEGRNEAPTILQARQLLREARSICFLGFGFDQVNVARLGAPDVFCEGPEAPSEAPRAKTVAATARGLTRAEVHRAARQIFGPAVYTDSLLAHFRDMNCISLLRETLILGDA
jgi:hypothetical protein